MAKEKNYKQGWHFQPTANLTISEDGNTLQTHMNGANIQVSTAVGSGVAGVLDENGDYGMDTTQLSEMSNGDILNKRAVKTRYLIRFCIRKNLAKTDW